MSKLKVGDVEFYYELHGEGEPLVLISGYTGDHLQWEEHVSRLSEKHKVLIFDNQAVGQTKDDGRSFTVEDMADNTVALCKELGIEKFSAVGHSMGGSIAQKIAIRHPEVVDKLILSCSSAKWNEVTIYAFETNFKMIDEGVKPDTMFEAYTPWCCGREFLKDETKMKRRYEEMMENPHPMSVADLRRQFDALEKIDTTDHLDKIKAPTLVISGDEDLLALPKDTKVLMEGIPNTTQKILSCAHMPTIERTDEWIEAVTEFLG